MCTIEVSTRVRTLERACRSLKGEKTNLVDELDLLKSAITSKDNELKENRTAYREAQDEIAKISDK